MKRLVFLTLSLTRGGAERVICNMCNEYFAKKNRVIVISLMAAEPEYELHPDIRFLTIDQTKEQYKQNLALRFIRRRKALGSVIQKIEKEEGKIDALISFLPEPNLLITSLAGKCEFPIVISVRNDPVKEYQSTVRQMLMRMLYPKADGYVFQTEQAKDYFSFSKHITEQCVIIPNPLGKQFIGIKRSENRRPEIAVVGRLELQKDPFNAITAFAKICEEFPSYQLCFYGEGSLRESMQETIERLGLQERIILKGNVERVQDVICDVALYILSSKYEGMPNALMEAMAMGVPCIATDCPCGGPEYLIQSGENGLLVPVEDSDALAKAMKYVLETPEDAERMAENAQGITDLLCPENIYQKWERFVDERQSKKQM